MHEDLLVLHPCLHQHTTPTHQHYLAVTSLTGAGPGGHLAHMDGPPNHHYPRAAKTFFYGAACHSYYSINEAWLLR